MTLIHDTDEVQEPIGDTNVSADYTVTRQPDGTNHIDIYGWSSYNPKQGNTTKALSILRQLWYPCTIRAIDCGHPRHDSYRYWQHQLAKGRIDRADDDEGNPIRPLESEHPVGCRQHHTPQDNAHAHHSQQA